MTDLFNWQPLSPSLGGFPTDTEPVTPSIPTDVEALFERFALELIGRGFKHYSSDAILHRIRWHYHVEQGDRDFKCNDHWTSHLARWFIARHPEHKEFFELRALRHERKREAA